jgi:hypothetical protein
MTNARRIIVVLPIVVAGLLPPARAAAVTCTVPANPPTITAALADATCDPIVIVAGTYDEGPLTVSRSVTIRGPNAGTPGDGSRRAEAAIMGASDAFQISAGTVTIDGLQIGVTGVAVASVGTPASVTVANSVISGATGVSLAVSEGVTLAANRVTANGTGVGLEVRGSGSQPVVVRDNLVENVVNPQATVSAVAYGINVQDATGPVSITGNTVRGTTIGAASTFMDAQGIRVFTGAAGAVVTDNVVIDTGCDFNGCDATGISVFTTSGTGGAIEIRGNTIVDSHALGVSSINNATGIFAFGSGAIQVSGNTVRLTVATSNSIAGASALQAFSDEAPVTVAENLVVTTLAIGTSIASAEGVVAGRDSTVGVLATRNQVHETYGVGPTGDGRAIVAFSFEGSAAATDNVVVGVDGAGVSVLGKVDATASGNRVSSGGAPGVQVGGGTGVGLAEGNVVLDATGAGVLLVSGYEPATTLRGRGNHVERASASAFHIGNPAPAISPTVEVSGNTMLDSAAGVTFDAAIDVQPGTSVSARLNRIVGNDVGLDHRGRGSIDATNNWWGCNEGPGQPGCDAIIIADSVNASVDADPWLTLSAIASSPSVAVAVAGDLTRNSDGQDTSGAGHLPDDTPVTFSTTFGTLTPTAAGTVDGVAHTTLSADAGGTATVTVALDNASASTTVELAESELLSGKRLLLKDNARPAKRAVQLLSKDGRLTLGDGNGSGDDPTANGGSLRLRSSVAGVVLFDVTHDLPAARWRRIGRQGANKGYKLKNAGPVRLITVKAGRGLKLVGKGDLGFSLGSDPEPVDVVVTLGTLRYCITFGGQTRFEANKRYAARNAPAPSACAP